MKKVSFDFDSTLSRPYIQKYAKELLEKGFEVWIVTSRTEDPPVWIIGGNKIKQTNDDLFNIAEKIGIQRDNIIFTEYNPKSEFFKNNNDFIFHLDDDSIELDFINKETKVKGISCWNNTTWRRKCDKMLGLYPFNLKELGL